MSLQAKKIKNIKLKFNYEGEVYEALVPNNVNNNKSKNKFLNNDKINDELFIDNELNNNFNDPNNSNSFIYNDIESNTKNNLSNNLNNNISIDLNSFLAPNPKNLYLVQVSGQSMINENIYNGDILIVDKNEIPKDGKIVIASLNGDMFVKTLRIKSNKVYLYSANSQFLPIEILPEFNFKIQGVVKNVIHSL